jgi:catechol 2,3-dioxygenase-like lactoylglutathione lyase family enzyme
MLTADIKIVAHVGVTVSDMGRAVAFYRDILGYPVSGRVQATGAMFDDLNGVPGSAHEVCFVRVPGLIIELLCYSKPEHREHSTLRACDAGAVHIALKVKSVERVLAAAVQGGFKPLSSIQTMEKGPLKGLRVVFVRDPDGVVLELHEEPPGIILEEVVFCGAMS